MSNLPIHLVLGDAAGGVLRAACEQHGLPGSVHVIADDLSHGPLHDGRVRLRYMRECFVGYGIWQSRVLDAFAGWDGLVRRAADALALGDDVELTVWAGDNASEAVLLAMACWRLGAGAERDDAEPTAPGVPEPSSVLDQATLSHAAPPQSRNRHHVAQHGARALAACFAQRRCLGAADRAAQAAVFRALQQASRTETGQLRLWQQRRLVSVPADRFDPLLLRACGQDWRPAAGVIGSAMAAADPHNLTSDLFLSARLQRLIERGRVEVLGPGQSLQDYWVRLPGERAG
jgi:hypothetical protein